MTHDPNTTCARGKCCAAARKAAIKVRPPTEAFEHQRVCMLLEQWQRDGRCLKWSHLASESSSKAQRIKNARNGLKPGLPDFIIVFSKKTCFVELKKRRGGKVSPEQKEWLSALVDGGCPAAVARGFDEAKAFLEKHENNK
jgi:hypothetical protein